MKNANKCRTMVLSLLISVILGVALGAGVAFASEQFSDLSSGTYDMYAYHSDSYPGGTLWDSYYEKENVSRSADSTTVTINSSQTRKYYGSASTNYICFGNMWIADEYNNHNVFYNCYAARSINGIDRTCDTYWTYSSLNSTNNYVDLWQDIWLEDAFGYLSTIGTDLTSFYTGIGTRR